MNRRWIYISIYVFILASIGWRLYFEGWKAAWKPILAEQVLEPHFGDFRVIQGGVKSDRAGFDPIVKNPFDPWKRRMNYPRIWISIGKFFQFENETAFNIFGIAMIACYVSAWLFLIYRFPSALLTFLACNSPSLIAMERANIELLIFALIVAAALSRPVTSFFFWILACALKLFPLSLLPLMVANRRLRVASLVSAVAIVALNFYDLANIRTATPMAMEGTGVISLSMGIASLGFGTLWPGPLALILLSIPALLAFMGCRAPRHEVPDPERKLFLFGSIIYTATFVLIGSNFDYRLAFLALCAPYASTLKGGEFNFVAFILIWIFLLNPLNSVYEVWPHIFNLASKTLIFEWLIWRLICDYSLSWVRLANRCSTLKNSVTAKWVSS